MLYSEYGNDPIRKDHLTTYTCEDKTIRFYVGEVSFVWTYQDNESRDTEYRRITQEMLTDRGYFIRSSYETIDMNLPMNVKEIGRIRRAKDRAAIIFCTLLNYPLVWWHYPNDEERDKDYDRIITQVCGHLDDRPHLRWQNKDIHKAPPEHSYIHVDTPFWVKMSDSTQDRFSRFRKHMGYGITKADEEGRIPVGMVELSQFLLSADEAFSDKDLNPFLKIPKSLILEKSWNETDFKRRQKASLA